MAASTDGDDIPRPVTPIPETLDQKPSLRYFNRYVREVVSDQWLDLGRELLNDKNQSVLKTIDADERTVNARCSKLIDVWKQRQPNDATWRNLITALRNILLTDEADMVSKRLKPAAGESNKPMNADDSLWPFDKAQPVALSSIVVPRAPSPGSIDFSDGGLPSYDMTAKPRGAAVIINNKIFTCASLDKRPRDGTDKDAAALKFLFEHFDFHTKIFHNQTGSGILEVLGAVSKLDHSKSSCLIVAILSHGLSGQIYGTDGQLISVRYLVSLFSGKNCPSLVGKPKVFILQACRGTKLDEGVDVPDGPHDLDTTDSKGMLPNEADFLLAHSTVAGYQSWRKAGAKGSYFITALVYEFSRLAKTEHVLDMLTAVNYKMATEYQPGGGNKQMPGPAFTLRKKLYFPEAK